jgi:hypothetical protein
VPAFRVSHFCTKRNHGASKRRDARLVFVLTGSTLHLKRSA